MGGPDPQDFEPQRPRVRLAAVGRWPSEGYLAPAITLVGPLPASCDVRCDYLSDPDEARSVSEADVILARTIDDIFTTDGSPTLECGVDRVRSGRSPNR